MTIASNEPRPEAIIDGLHKIREDLIAESGNDLRAYVEAARKRQNDSGRPVVSRPPVATVPFQSTENAGRHTF